MPVSANIGLGTGGFNTIADGAAGTDESVLPFASLGFGLFKNFTALADWTTNHMCGCAAILACGVTNALAKGWRRCTQLLVRVSSKLI